MKATRLISLLLTLLLLLLCFPVLSFAEETIYVLTASDFQEGSHAGSTAVLSQIISSIKSAGHTQIDGFLFAGDYDRNTIGSYADTQNGLKTLRSLIKKEYPQVEKEIYAQGNHDPAGVTGLSKSGANDADKFGVFVINNDDYMWYNSNEEKIRQTAQSLHSYLENKKEEGYSKPIFVVSHLPLHYSKRTELDGDAQYANYIFDELNDAAALGLNIIFLFGHDHSHGWDNYLGGSAICLLPGDKIKIARSSRTIFSEETLSFTYLNAGYTGYYSSNNGSDDTLTACLFAITGDEISISRYDKDGLHNLKSAGTYNIEYDDRFILPADKRVYSSPQSLALSTSVKTKNIFEEDTYGITVRTTADDVNFSFEADAEAQEFFADKNKYNAFIEITVDPVGKNIGKAELTIPYDFLEGSARLYIKDGNNFLRADPECDGGRMHLQVDLPVSVVLAVPNDPYLSSSYSGLLWRAEVKDGSFAFYNLEKELYLSCIGNATVSGDPALLTLTPFTNGYKLALTNATGGKAAGESLHLGTANKVSFGEYSPFLFYAFSGNDRFTELTNGELPKNGVVYLLGCRSGVDLYLLSGTPDGARLLTEKRTVELIDEDTEAFKDSAYFSNLFKAEQNEDGLSLKHIAGGGYLSCDGNASYTATKAYFTTEKQTNGVAIVLNKAIGGKNAGDALHINSSTFLVSFGDASPVTLYEYIEKDTFLPADHFEEGKYYLISFVIDEKDHLLNGSVQSSGTSSRLVTAEMTVEIYRSPYDLNFDGSVNISDVTTLLDVLSGKIPEQAYMDLDGDKVVNIRDVTTLLNTISGT